MIRLFLISMLFYLQFKDGFAFLNESEEIITIEMIQILEIKHWIIVSDSYTTPNNLLKSKTLIKLNLLFMYRSIEQLYEYLSKEIYVNINTLVIFKVSNLHVIKNFINSLLSVSINRIQKNLFLLKNY